MEMQLIRSTEAVNSLHEYLRRMLENGKGLANHWQTQNRIAVLSLVALNQSEQPTYSLDFKTWLKANPNEVTDFYRLQLPVANHKAINLLSAQQMPDIFDVLPFMVGTPSSYVQIMGVGGMGDAVKDALGMRSLNLIKRELYNPLYLDSNSLRIKYGKSIADVVGNSLLGV